MKLRILSDIHLEVSEYDVPALDTDPNTTLILAGDIAPAKRTSLLKPFMEDLSNRFANIIYVMGNHEHWKGNISYTEKKLKDMFSELSNVHVLEDNCVDIDDIRFIGSTLWTDFDRANPLKLFDANTLMKDYQKIRYGRSYFKLRANDILLKHRNSVRMIEDMATSTVNKKVLITHHAPSAMSVHPRFQNDTKYYGLYHSNLDNLLIDCDISLAVHGHMHDSFDYMVDQCRVICNPRGYVPHEPNRLFNPILKVDV